MHSGGLYYIHVKPGELAFPLMQFRSLKPPEFILLALRFSLKSVAKCIFCNCLKT